MKSAKSAPESSSSSLNSPAFLEFFFWRLFLGFASFVGASLRFLALLVALGSSRSSSSDSSKTTSVFIFAPPLPLPVPVGY
jgi:hypothetical protein